MRPGRGRGLARMVICADDALRLYELLDGACRSWRGRKRVATPVALV